MGDEGLEPSDVSAIQDNGLRNPPYSGAAKSGAVGNEPPKSGSATLDMMAAFVAILSPEQRSALGRLLAPVQAAPVALVATQHGD